MLSSASLSILSELPRPLLTVYLDTDPGERDNQRSSRRRGLPRRASHRTGLAGLASGSLDRCLRRPDQAGQRLPREDSLSTRGHRVRSTGSRTTHWGKP